MSAVGALYARSGRNCSDPVVTLRVVTLWKLSDAPTPTGEYGLVPCG